ncbi:MAG: hypothetical protein KC503_34600 [Myxococcales bacterium]|nr:hypothetical protein [Myxococcales bacterium]
MKRSLLSQRSPRLAFALLLACACLSSAPAAAQKRLSLGVFLPTVPGVSRADRFAAAGRLATFLGKRVGVTVTGRSFAASNLIKRGTVQIAIVPAQLAAERGWTAFAALRRGGGARATWAIYAKGATRLTELANKTVAVTRVGGKDSRFVTNVMLEREVGAGYFKWARFVDWDATIKAVSFGRAQAVVVRSNASVSGLTRVFTSRALPNPVAVFVSPLPKATRDKVAAALQSYPGGWLGFSGFTKIGAATIRTLRGQLLAGRRGKRVVAARPDGFALPTRAIVAADASAPKPPSALALVEPPKLKPDVAAER